MAEGFENVIDFGCLGEAAAILMVNWFGATGACAHGYLIVHAPREKEAAIRSMAAVPSPTSIERLLIYAGILREAITDLTGTTRRRGIHRKVVDPDDRDRACGLDARIETIW